MSGVKKLPRQHRHDWAGSASQLCSLHVSLLLSAIYLQMSGGVDPPIRLFETIIIILQFFCAMSQKTG